MSVLGGKEPVEGMERSLARRTRNSTAARCGGVCTATCGVGCGGREGIGLWRVAVPAHSGASPRRCQPTAVVDGTPGGGGRNGTRRWSGWRRWRSAAQAPMEGAVASVRWRAGETRHGGGGRDGPRAGVSVATGLEGVDEFGAQGTYRRFRLTARGCGRWPQPHRSGGRQGAVEVGRHGLRRGWWRRPYGVVGGRGAEVGRYGPWPGGGPMGGG